MALLFLIHCVRTDRGGRRSS